MFPWNVMIVPAVFCSTGKEAAEGKLIVRFTTGRMIFNTSLLEEKYET
jgi:hypothetical protein